MVDSWIRHAGALAIATDVIETIEECASNPSKAAGWALAVITPEQNVGLKALLNERLAALDEQELASLPELDFVIHRLRDWGDANLANGRLRAILASDQYLLTALTGYLRYSRRRG